MLKYDRLEAPPCLTPEVRERWTRAFRTSGKIDWKQNECRRTLVELLHVASGERCAFCDGRLGVESLATVEHFRPKSGIHGSVDLAFDWTNLFPACDVCQSAKREKWDDRLLKPDHADYAFDRYFYCNFLTGAVDPLPVNVGGDPERAQIFLNMYDLCSTKRCKMRIHERRNWQRARAAEDVLDDYNFRFFLRDD